VLDHEWLSHGPASELVAGAAGHGGSSGLLGQFQRFNAARARRAVEHCLGAAIQHLPSGAAVAAAALEGEAAGARGYLLEEQGWQARPRPEAGQ
jgi:hypothetical protein